jgi:hypothetical protein
MRTSFVFTKKYHELPSKKEYESKLSAMKRRIEMQNNHLSSDPQSKEMIPEVDSAHGKSS